MLSLMYLFLLQPVENVPFCVAEYFVLGLVVSVPELTENVPLFVVEYVVVEFVAHGFSFAECDDDKKR